MNPLIGICAKPEHATAVRDAGADFLEVTVVNFLVPTEDEATFAPHEQAALQSPLPVRYANSFLPPSLPCVGPVVDNTALLVYAERAFARAQRLGVGCIVFGSGGSRNVPAGFSVETAKEQFLSLLRRIAPVAEGKGVTIAIEPLNARECNFINTLAEGAEMAEACGHPSVGLLADTYHMGFAGEGPEELRRFAPRLRHVHVAEYPSRRFPGADGTSLRDHFAALRESSYAGAVSVECVWGDLPAEVGYTVANLKRDLAE